MDGRMHGRTDGWMWMSLTPQFSTIPNTFTGVRAPACRSAFKYSLNGRGRSRPPGRCRYFTANTNKSAEEECGLKWSRGVFVLLLTSNPAQKPANRPRVRVRPQRIARGGLYRGSRHDPPSIRDVGLHVNEARARECRGLRGWRRGKQTQ